MPVLLRREIEEAVEAVVRRRLGEQRRMIERPELWKPQIVTGNA